MTMQDQIANLMLGWNDPAKKLSMMSEARTTMRKYGVTPEEELIMTDKMLGKDITTVQLETGYSIEKINELHDSGMAKLKPLMPVM